MPAVLTPVDPPAAGPPPPFLEPRREACGGEDGGTVLKSRVAMLREKLLQKRQDASMEQDVTPVSAPQSEATTPIESFLAEGSNRHALQTLAEQMARRADKLGPPPEVDLPRAQLGDEMLDDFMSRACRGKKGPPTAETNGAYETIPKEKKAKKRKKRKEKPAALESNVFLQAESDIRHWQPSEPAEASPEPASAEPVLEEEGQAESVDGIEKKPKKSKKRRDRNKKAKVKSDGSNETKRSKKAAGKSIQADGQKVSRQRKDTKKAHKSRKASSRKVTKEDSGSEGSSEEERKAKAEERCARERERRAEEAARRRERRAEHSRERRERSAGRAKRQDRSRHRSRSRRRSVSRTRDRSQKRRRGGKSRSRSGGSASASGRRGRSRSRSRGGRRRSSSSGGSRGEASSSGQPEEFKPFSRVVLQGLQVNKELNGLCGLVAPPGLPTAGDLAGAYKVRLETGREVAARPQNLEPVRRELSPGRARRLELVEERLRAGA